MAVGRVLWGLGDGCFEGFEGVVEILKVLWKV